MLRLLRDVSCHDALESCSRRIAKHTKTEVQVSTTRIVLTYHKERNEKSSWRLLSRDPFKDCQHRASHLVLVFPLALTTDRPARDLAAAGSFELLLVNVS